MKILFFVEGELEDKALTGFIRRWLEPKLKSKIGLTPVKFKGCMDLVKATPQKAKMRLADEKVVAVFSLIDLHCPNLYPDHKQSAEARYAWGKQHIEEKVGDSRFKHFFAVHETEAWFLSDPEIFSEPEIKKAVIKKSVRPEKVNFDKLPSKFLEDAYKKAKKDYRKVKNGVELFKKLDPEVAYSKCPRLREFLDEVLRVAQAAMA